MTTGDSNNHRSILAGLLALCVLAGALVLLPAVAAAEECPNAAFRIGPSAQLPDCRAYELVTPPFKNDGWPRVGKYGPAGESLTMLMNTAAVGLESFPMAGLYGPEAYYSIRRTAMGWTTMADAPPSSEYLASYLPKVGTSTPDNFAGESRDGLTTAWMERGVRQPENSLSIFLRTPDGAIVDVGPGLPPATPPGSVLELAKASQMEVAGLSPDGSQLLFTLQGDRWPFDDSESGTSLYEYTGTGNTTPLLVGVDQAGAPISRCGTALGAPSDLRQENEADNAISADGRTIFFTAVCGTRTGDELYARIDNGEPGAHTVDISEPAPTDCGACDTEAGALAGAHFESASQDGSKVFFSTTQPLLPGATGLNFYEYDFDAPAGERVVRVSGGAPDPELLETSRPLFSADGSHVYFLAKGVLTSTPNTQGETAQAGADNLYVFEREANDPAGRTTFVAKLSGEDVEQWEHELAGGDVTPDGRFLVFTSERDLTPDDTSSGVRQAFEYDAQTGALVRVSIGQDGFNHDGNVAPLPTLLGFGQTFNDADNAEIVTSSGKKPMGTSVSADGSYVFFQSSVGLTPQAVDRKVVGSFGGQDISVNLYANNVYEYHDGRVSLISDGQDFSFRQTTEIGQGSEVQLLGTDESGRDVLLLTADRLAGQDTDTSADIYDARVDGGFPPPAAPTPCSGEGCQGSLSAAPTLLSPGSELQAGGNPPLVGASAGKAKAKPKKSKKSTGRVKSKRRKSRRGSKAGRPRIASRGERARRAAVGGRAERKAGR